MLHVAAVVDVAAVGVAAVAVAVAAVNCIVASSYGLTFNHFKGYIILGVIGYRQPTRINIFHLFSH